MKPLFLFITTALIASCTTATYIRGDEPIIVSAIVEKNGIRVIEAYGLDLKSDRKYIYFESKHPYNIGDTLWIIKK